MSSLTGPNGVMPSAMLKKSRVSLSLLIGIAMQTVCAWIPKLFPTVVTKERSALVPVIVEVAKRCPEASARRPLLRVLCEDQKSWKYDSFVQAICAGFVELGAVLSPAQIWDEIVVEVPFDKLVMRKKMRSMAAAAEVVGVLAPVLGPDKMFDVVRMGWEDEVRVTATMFSIELDSSAWTLLHGMAKGMKRLALGASSSACWKGWDEERLRALSAVVLEVAISSMHVACDMVSFAGLVYDDKTLSAWPSGGDRLDITFLHLMVTEVLPCLVRKAV